MSEDNKFKDTIDAVKGLCEAVPVYQDLVQPAAKEVGKAFGTVAKSINLVLAPLGALVWGYEKIKDYVEYSVSEKLKNVPQEDIQSPRMPNVVGPALEALRYTGNEILLRELYANLLATSLDAQTTSPAHPSFVEIIKQMTPDEARLMRSFATDGIRPVISINARKKEGGYGIAFRHFFCWGKRLRVNSRIWCQII